MKKSIFALGVCCFLALGIPPALQADELPGPPASSDLITKGLWWLYHIQYDKSYACFEQYSKEHPDDPAGFFYRTAVSWWHLAQNFDSDLPQVRKRFDDDYQLTVDAAQKLYESAHNDKTRAWACLYWGGAEGLKGRWLVTQGQWIKAYFLGKSGNNRLHKALTYDPTLYDAYMGIGIYDYFTDTLGGVQKVLAALLIRGDRQRGLNELQIAIDKGTHARIEAKFFLVEIYTFEEDTPEKALPIIQSLRKEFPLSPAVELSEVTALYAKQDWEPMMEAAQDLLEKSESETPWFTHEGIAPALYCLGVGTLYGRASPDKAERYFDRILAISGASSRWVTFAYLKKGQIYDLRKDRAQAMNFYSKVLSRPNFWGSHKEARLYLKKPYSWEKPPAY